MLDHILFFTTLGRVFSLRGYQIPEGKRTSRGTSILNLLNLDPEERIATVMPVHDFDAARFVVLATRRGIVKRMSLDEFRRVRPSGLIAARIREGDSLVAAVLTGGEDDLILVSEGGRALRFSERELRPMGRASVGVRGMRLAPGDVLASVDVVEPGAFLFLVTANGFGKIVPLDEYQPHGRGTRGVLTMPKRGMKKTGRIVAARVVRRTDQALIVTAAGIGLRMRLEEMRPLGRSAIGVGVIDLQEGDEVAAVAVMRNHQKESAGKVG
jgi:DNA gyrase subunit A